MGLLNDTTESHICLDDAIKAGWDPRRVRTLFYLLIIEGAPAADLFGLHEDFMAKDFRCDRRSPVSKKEARNRLLTEIAARIEASGKDMTRMNLPEPVRRLNETEREMDRHNCDTCIGEYHLQMSSANVEQQTFMETIFEKIDANRGGLFYLDGPPGRGKTFTLLALVNYVRGKNKVALCCATTGFVAVMYPGGRTAHNLFKISVNDDPSDITPIQCDVGEATERADLLRSASLIIWDEFTMNNRENFEAVDTILRKIRRNNSPLGGVLFVGAGDFRQLPLVIQYGTKEDIINATIKSSPLWKYFTILQLTVPVRQLGDPQYAT